MAPLIGYYAHHHGSGHVHRARLIAESYPGPVDVLGSGNDSVVTVPLPPDADPDRLVIDPTANEALHWAPRHSPLLAPRAAALVEWAIERRPALVVVDVSVEVALLVRLLGVPVVIIRQHGNRTDTAHRLAHQLADALLAPYPEWAEDASASRTARTKTRYCGGFSRFDDRPPPSDPRDPGQVVVMAGSGGTTLDAESIVHLAGTDDRAWTVIGIEGPSGPGCEFLGRIADPWPWLSRAGVVVTSAGHSALCEVAAARAPTVALAEPRPFAEQANKVEVLAAAGLVHPAPPVGDRSAWDHILRTATGSSPPWQEFVDGHGLERTIGHLVELATMVAPGGAPPAVAGQPR